ncbi:rod shape-determining protein MreD [Candidatus Omnitrophota bacterium]
MRKINRAYLYSSVSLGLALHMTVLGHVKVFGAKPDIMLLLVVFFGLFGAKGMGLEAGIVSGVLRDVFSSGPFGVNTVILAGLGFLTEVIGPRVYRESGAAQFSLTFSMYFLYSAAYHIFGSAVSRPLSLLGGTVPGPAGAFAASVFSGALYTSVAALFIFRWLTRYFGLEEY